MMKLKKPQLSERRIKKSFLLFPKKICEEWRWLEIAYRKEYYWGQGDFYEPIWIELCWSTKEEYESFRKKEEGKK